jgi:hypothetical protein
LPTSTSYRIKPDSPNLIRPLAGGFFALTSPLRSREYLGTHACQGHARLFLMRQWSARVKSHYFPRIVDVSHWICLAHGVASKLRMYPCTTWRYRRRGHRGPSGSRPMKRQCLLKAPTVLILLHPLHLFPLLDSPPLEHCSMPRAHPSPPRDFSA